ncbi:MAG: 23S rRNA (guanosine(2251)-2'-O)-methyltransferase RlmB [Ginsengibacter sp.]
MRTPRSFQQQHRPKKSALIIGKEKIIQAAISGEQIERIYISNTIGKEAEEIKKIAEQFNIPVNKVPLQKINSFNVDGHDGCVALRGKIMYQDLQKVISFVVEKGEVPLFLLLDGITDIRNIGAIARTAYCAGVHAIVIPEKGVGALNEDAIATSAGALEKIAVCRVGSLLQAVEELHLNGISVMASEMKAAKKIFEISFTPPCAIIMGSEDKGIFPSLLKICDEQFSIPMKGEFESLNVSVAAGMILYECLRQRN